MKPALHAIRMVAPDGTVDERLVMQQYPWAVAVRRENDTWALYPYGGSERGAQKAADGMRAQGFEARVIPVENTHSSRCCGITKGEPCVLRASHFGPCRSGVRQTNAAGPAA